MGEFKMYFLILIYIQLKPITQIRCKQVLLTLPILCKDTYDALKNINYTILPLHYDKYNVKTPD